MLVRLLSFFLAFSSLSFINFPAFGGSPGCLVPPQMFLNQKLAFWQQRLDLSDWQISILLSHSRDLKPGTLGNVHWDSEKKTAVIRVLSPNEYHASCHSALDDMEVTLVHELVHLELSSLPRPQASRGEEERAVNRITDALLKMETAESGAPDVASAVQGTR